MPRVLVLLLAVSLALAGCGSDEPSDGAAATDDGEQTAVDDVAAEPAEDSEDSDADEADEPSDDPGAAVCAAVTSVDLAAAFGTLTFGDARPQPGRTACIVPINEAEGEGLIVQVAEGRGTYDLKQGYEEQSDVSFAMVDGLGAEAFVLNDADLNVLLDDGDSLVVALQAFVVDPDVELPDPATRVAALTTVANAVIDR